jgi:hypothetical protein
VEQWKELSAAEFEMKVFERRVPFSRLSDTIHYGYFWTSLAKTSLIPTFGIFFRLFRAASTRTPKNERRASVCLNV